MTERSIQSIFSGAYQPLYISLLSVCLIIAIEVYHKIHCNIGRKSENAAFHKVIISYLAYIIVDLLWIMTYMHEDFVVFSKTMEYIETAILANFAYFWFEFAEYYIDGFPIKKGRVHMLFRLPILFADFVSVFFCLNFIGVIGHTRLSSSLIYAINPKVDFFYLLFTFFHTLVCMMKEKKQSKKRRYLVIMQCVLYPALAAIASLFIHFVPFIHLGIIPSILKALIEMQNANIYTDALTGINNRYRVREYLEKIWDHTTEKNPVVIYLIDINKFKGINDQYGHLIGDQALVAVADSLKVIATEGIVIDRFGGDEFILADPLNHDPQSIQKELREELRKASLAHHFPFDLTLSIGYAKATQACQKIPDIVSLADKNLYQDKAKYK